jgi:competence protein ComEC
MARPMLVLAVFLALGARMGPDLSRAEALLVAALSLVAVLLSTASPAAAALAAASSAALGLGACAAALEGREYAGTPLRSFACATDEARLVHVSGIAVGDAEWRDRLQSVVLDVTAATLGGRAVDLSGRLRLHVVTDDPRPVAQAGDLVEAWADVRAPRGYADPGAMDVEALARRDGIHAIGFCKSARLVESRHGRPGPSWIAAARAVRKWARDVIEASLPEGRERAVVLAMTLGDQRGIDDETAETFRIAGTYHVLALSGAQVALLAGGLILIARRVGAGPVLQAFALTPILAFYATLVGGQVPIVRATVMALVALWGRALDLDVDLANLLGLAAAALLLVQPSAVGDVGFELSFAATLAILVVTPVVQAGLPRLPLRLELSVAASVASQLALWPLLAARFHRVAPAAVVLNLAAVPLSGLVLLTGLALLAAGVMPALAVVLAPPAWLSAHLLLWTGDLVRGRAWLDVRAPSPDTLAVLVYVAGLVALVRRRRVATVLLALGIVGMQWPAPPADGLLHVDVLDVGQGDAILIRTPRGRAWQVDAGGSATAFDVGEWVVAPYLWSIPVVRLEGIVVSHAHMDHVGGVPFLLRHFAPGALWEGPAPRADAGYRLLDKAAGASSASRVAVGAGTTSMLDGVQIEILAPRSREGPPLHTRNDDSVIVRVRFGAVSFLLTGDAESPGEEALAAPDATVLKVAHHGSRTSSSERFLDRTGPRVAVISVGARNKFGHPAPDVLARYARRGIRVFRTDRDGAVQLATDGRRVWARTFHDGFDARFDGR